MKYTKRDSGLKRPNENTQIADYLSYQKEEKEKHQAVNTEIDKLVNTVKALYLKKYGSENDYNLNIDYLKMADIDLKKGFIQHHKQLPLGRVCFSLTIIKKLV